MNTLVRMRSLVVLCVLLVLLLRPTASHAEPAPPPTTTTSYYGWQVLGTDIAAQALGFALADDTTYSRASPLLVAAGGPPLRATFDAMTGDRIEWASLGTYLIAAPIVHLAHGRPKTALYSLGLRAGAPIGGAALGLLGGVVLCAVCEGGDWDPQMLLGIVFGTLGAAAGYLAAVVVDAGPLSVEERPRREPSAVRFAPLFQARSGGGVAGLGGTF